MESRIGRSLNLLADDFTPAQRIPTCARPWRGYRGRGFHDGLQYRGANTIRQASLQGNGNGPVPSTSPFDPFVTTSNPLAAANAVGPVQANPFSPDTAAAALGGATFFTGQTGFQPVGRSKTVTFPVLTFARFNITCMPRLAPTARTPSDINATYTTSFYLTTSARSCKRRQPRRYKHCLVCVKQESLCRP